MPRGLKLRIAGEALRIVPMSLLSRMGSQEPVGLCYHSISERQGPHLKHLYPTKTVGQFECDIEYLLDHYTMLDYAAIREHRERKSGEKPPAFLTFDDGLSECYHTIRPLLLRKGVPAIFFATSEFVDNRELFYRNAISLCIDAYEQLTPSAAVEARRNLSTILRRPLNDARDVARHLGRLSIEDQARIDDACRTLGVKVHTYLASASPYLTGGELKALANDGFTIGAHGTRHTHLGSLSESELRQEIITSCTAIANMVGSSEVPFAFPFNGNGVRRETLRSLRVANPYIGLFFDSRMLARDVDFILNRIVVDEPPRFGATRTNLPAFLRIAHIKELLSIKRNVARISSL
jgi:peptidoglycan/xylan/chitin deacetylase (PgdA/CDA1 family)